MPYTFTTDWFTNHEANWRRHFAPYYGRPNLRILELGSFEGRSTCWLLDHVLTHPTSTITCVDTFTSPWYVPLADDLESRFDANVRASASWREGKVTRLRGESGRLLRQLPTELFDIAYVDGSHEPEDVLEDLALVWRLMKPGGMVICDDYDLENHPERRFPRPAFDAFLHCFAPRIQDLAFHKGCDPAPTQLVFRRKPELNRTASARRNLVVRSCGPSALPMAPADSDNWDLIEHRWGGPPAYDWAGTVWNDADRKFRAAIRRLPVLRRYDAIAVIDDDIVPATSWSAIFELFHRTGARVAQPALTPDSPWSHEITVQQPALSYRWTTFVEVQCPILRADVIEAYLAPALAYEFNWGLESFWSHHELAAGRLLAILDATPVHHTRPVVGYGRKHPAWSELDRFLAEYGLSRARESTVGCVAVGGSGGQAGTVAPGDAEPDAAAPEPSAAPHIAILTVGRTENYIDATMASLFASDAATDAMRVVLFADTDEPRYLEKYRADPRVEIVALPPDRAAAICDFDKHTRFNNNYLRCLESAGTSGVLIFEDDVEFRPDWWLRFRAVQREMEEVGHKSFGLALYAPEGTPSCDLFDPSLRRGKNYCSYVACCFYGTQGMYFTQDVARSAAEFIRQEGFHYGHLPGDILLNRLFDRQQNLYACARSLVQHVGRNTTGIGTFHQSATFGLAWPGETG